MRAITLTTDFGLRDTYVGILKGVILSIAPGAPIVDITHEIPPQDVMAATLALESSVPFFPRGSVHLAVVDPGVGSERHAIALETSHGFLVGPDNGLFTALLDDEDLLRAVRLTNPRYFRSTVSATFHGRDVFAPVAAYLATGIPLPEFGEAATDLVRLEMPRPVRREHSVEAHVIHVDRFGNLITDLTEETWRQLMPIDPGLVAIIVRGEIITGLSRTFTDVPRGKALAYFGSGRRLEIGLRDGSAALELGAVTGATVTLRAIEP